MKNTQSKKWIPIPSNEEQLIELEEILDLGHIPARLLSRQGIRSKIEAEQFLKPSLQQLHDPFRMHGMMTALERIHAAIDNQERILIYGDYDVDGVTSVSLLYHFLSQYTEYLDFYIPDRYKEGYGLSMEGIDYAAQNNVKLIITVDCGIKAIAPVSAAKLSEIDCIICDHHLPGDQLPAAFAILNPKQAACSYPYKELSGCGIAFKLIQAFAQADGWIIEELHEYLDLVAVSIAADIVPMTGENRVLAHFGLRQINGSPRPGLAALIDKKRMQKNLRIEDLVFGIGPMINAAGRISDAREAVQLLLEEDETVAFALANRLRKRNEMRKIYDKQIVEEAKQLFELQSTWAEQSSIVLFYPEWHKGIIGIAAARLVDHYFRPTIILTESNGKAVGSARSIPGFDIYSVIEECAEHLEQYGGHAHAAGLTLSLDKIGSFAKAFENAVQKRISAKQLERKQFYFSEVDLSEIGKNLWEELIAFAPFGPKNRTPVFVSRNVRDTGYSRLLKGEHLKLHIQQGDEKPVSAIAFYQGQYFERIQKEPFDICYTIKENHWNGKTSLQLMIKDIQFPANVKSVIPQIPLRSERVA